MVVIHKGEQPNALTREKAAGVRRYDELRTQTKNDIRDALLREQGNLCAYCMSRIHKGDMKIEHYVAQHPAAGGDDALTVDYGNMIAVCRGNEGQPLAYQTCDTHKGNARLTVNPFQQGSIDTITYKTDGVIQSGDAAIQHDLDVVLNLNYKNGHLIQNRKAALQTLQKWVSKDLKGRHAPPDYWRGLYAKVAGHRQDFEYVGILLWYIKRKM